MHIVVSWDVSEGLNRSDIVGHLVAVLKAYPWVKPLTTFYIVQATGAQREAIRAGLATVSTAYPGRVEFVITPLMSGSYSGVLPQKTWGNINTIAPPVK